VNGKVSEKMISLRKVGRTHGRTDARTDTQVILYSNIGQTIIMM